MKKLITMLMVVVMSIIAYSEQDNSSKICEMVKNELTQEQKTIITKISKEMKQVQNQDGTVNEKAMIRLEEAKQLKLQECLKELPEKTRAQVEATIANMKQGIEQKAVQLKEHTQKQN